MVKRFVIELIDDLDGSAAVETVRFGLDGAEYDIDLGKRNSEALRVALARFVAAGRRSAGTRRRASGADSSPAKHAAAEADMRAVRRWAAQHGLEVNSRGRIKEDIVQRYLASLS